MNEVTTISVDKEGQLHKVDLNNFNAALPPPAPTPESLALSCKIDLSIEPPIPPVILSILIDNVTYPIASLGNISVIIGKAKSRKTFLLTLFLAAWLAQGIFKRIFKAGAAPVRNRVILFDTEQAKYKVHQVGKKIQTLSENYSPLCLEVYGLRSKSVAERIEIIKHIAYNTDDLLAIAIDGLRDLLNDINDPTESSKTIGFLMKTSEECDIHIITALHQNKGDNNARGHIGTEAVNKAETVISVAKDEKNPDTSIVSPEYCREKEFPPFAIGIDDQGLPYVVGEWVGAGKEPSKKASTPYDYPVQTHETILNGAFHQRDQQLKYAQLVQQVKTSMQAIFGDVGEKRARDFAAYYLKMNCVRKEGKDNSPKSYYVRV